MHDKVRDSLGKYYKEYIKIWKHNAFSCHIKSPIDFAHAANIEVEAVAKTVLLARKTSKRRTQVASNFVAVCLSSQKRINFKQIASVMKWPRCEVASMDELYQITDYPINGVSPLGLIGLELIMDECLLAKPLIFVGTGTSGEELEISPLHVFDLAIPSICNVSQI